MEEEKLRFSFWKKISSHFKNQSITDPESCLVGHKIFITGKSSDNQPVDLIQYDISTDSWKSHPIQGLHPCSDGFSTLYLFHIPENSDYRYQIIQFSIEYMSNDILFTTGIAPKQRTPPLSSLYYQGCIYFFGGLQIFRGDATGSFIYKLDLQTYIWTNVWYQGSFPATIPNAPIIGCRSGHSTVRFGHKILIFGGTMIEQPLLSEDCLTSSVFDSYTTNDLHEFDLSSSKWTKIPYKTQACMIPSMSNHSAAGLYSFMYVYYQEKIYRYDINSMTWHRIKRNLKSPQTQGLSTLQQVDNYLYLFTNTPEGSSLFRLNLEKSWLCVSQDIPTDYSVRFIQNFFNHQPTADVMIKVQQNQIFAHRKILCKFSSFLHNKLTPGIKTITISEFSFSVIHMLIEQLYNDCTLELPREFNQLLMMYRAADWLEIGEIVRRCQESLVISALNLRIVVDQLGDIPQVRAKCLNYVHSHLKQAALLLLPEQLANLLSTG